MVKWAAVNAAKVKDTFIYYLGKCGHA